MKELLLKLEKDFPFDPSKDCVEKYTETIQDYLYENITTKLIF